jgi:hypothetical protein
LPPAHIVARAQLVARGYAKLSAEQGFYTTLNTWIEAGVAWVDRFEAFFALATGAFNSRGPQRNEPQGDVQRTFFSSGKPYSFS